MKQSPKQSFIESALNTLIATIIGITIGPLVYWFWNVPISPFQFTGVTFTFILISITRNYIIRRLFSKKNSR